MKRQGDGSTPMVFGVLLVDDHYEAFPGEVEFRGGRLVRVEFRRFRGDDPDGLTIGFTVFPDADPDDPLTFGKPDGTGFGTGRGINFLFARGELVHEIVLGRVHVRFGRGE